MTTDAIQAHLGVDRAQGRSLAWWGMVMTIMTEGMLFALALFVYYYLYGLADEWPLGGIEAPSLLIVSIRTVILFASSATMSIADRTMERGRRGLTILFVVLTWVLGAVFLAGHIREMAILPSEFRWDTNAYGSLFYVIVNFHGLHLAVGLIMLAFALVALVRGRYTADSHQGFKVVGMYWHFVDVVWAFVFPTLYLVPNLFPK